MFLNTELFLVGLGVGSFGTLIGAGGGFILVPVFLLLFHYTPQFAVGTSLAIVFFNALSGTIAYMRQKKVYYDAAIRFSLATLPGAVIGSYLAHYFTSNVFFYQLRSIVDFDCLPSILAFERRRRNCMQDRWFSSTI